MLERVRPGTKTTYVSKERRCPLHNEAYCKQCVIYSGNPFRHGEVMAGKVSLDSDRINVSAPGFGVLERGCVLRCPHLYPRHHINESHIPQSDERIPAHLETHRLQRRCAQDTPVSLIISRQKANTTASKPDTQKHYVTSMTKSHPFTLRYATTSIRRIRELVQIPTALLTTVALDDYCRLESFTIIAPADLITCLPCCLSLR